MHVITQKRMWEAKLKHPNCSSALDTWYRMIHKATIGTFGQLKLLFPSVDKVKDQYVFNIGGNKLRLIAYIHFNSQKVFIRQILTHKEYDKKLWIK